MDKKILFLSIVFSAFAANAQLKPVNYSDGKEKLQGLAGTPEKAGASKPGILILPAWLGIDEHSKTVSEKLNRLGYHTFIADIYGVGNKPQNTEEAGRLAGYYKKNYRDYQRRIKLALDQLIASGANAENIVAIGYCFGGTGVLEAARAGMPVKGVVSFHGGLGKDSSRPNNPIQANILICHGADDPFVPKAEIEAFQNEMREGNADWQMIYYADAVHAFTEPSAGNDKSKGAAYNANADKRSWQHFLLFLDEVLK